MKTIAIIPARGGSKSLPRKNIKPFGGHPLLAYSIAAGLQANSIERVIVSTDDEEIAAIARSFMADVPFLRPPELAQDDTPDLPVFQHALGWLLENEGYKPEIVVQLRPTSPLRPVDCVDQAVQILQANPEADSVRGVVPSGQNPYKMWQISAEGPMIPLLQGEYNEPYNMPRQELPETVWQTGHIDAMRASTILEKGSMSGEVILPLHLDPIYTVDLDTPLDWIRAESMLSHPDMEIVIPGPPPRSWPKKLAAVVFDFDGVLTDNRVWVDQDGKEMVAAHRGDGMGIEHLQQTGIGTFVISSESNPVVAARCRKLGIPLVQGVEAKGEVLQALLAEHNFDPQEVIFVGNDINDLPCFPLVGYSVAVADSHPDVLARADLVLTKKGGHGAVRELTDLILNKIGMS